MGLYQEELAKHKPHLLQDGKLELTNMLLFKSARRVPFPATIDHLLNKMKTGNKAKHALSSFRKFVESVFSHLAHPEGQARFQEKTRREMEMFPDESYEADYQRYVDELVDKERNKLNLLSEQLKAGKPYQQFQGQVQADAQDRAEFEEEFQGKSNNLAGDSVGKYLMSECTAQFYQKMEDWVDSGYTPTPVEMLWLGKELGKRWHMKQGHRPEWLVKFLFKHWHELLRNQESVMQLNGKPVLEPDDDDTITDLCNGWRAPTRELVTGYSVKLGAHKVAQHPLIVWLSQFDVMLGKMYECLRSRFLLSQPTMASTAEDPDRVFFINTKGSVMGYNCLDFADFCILRLVMHTHI